MVLYNTKEIAECKKLSIVIENLSINGTQTGNYPLRDSVIKDLNIVEEPGDFSASLSLFLNKDRDLYIPLYSGIKFYYGSNIFAAGLISKIEYVDPYFSKNSKLMKIEVVGYKKILQGRTIKFKEEDFDNYKNAGDIVKMLISKWLASDGIVAGQIEKGILLENVENIQGYDAVSFYQFLDYLAELSGYVWNISIDKTLSFYDPIKEIGNDWGNKGPEYQLTEDNSTFFNIDNILCDSSGYANKIFVIGGENEDDSIKETNLTADGFTYCWKENTEEVAKIKKTSISSGVVGIVLSRPEIKTLKQLSAIAEKELADRSSRPIEITISTYTSQYRVGDYIYVDLPKYAIKETLCLIRKETFIYGNCIGYKLTLKNKSQYLVGRDNAYAFFGKVNMLLQKRHKKPVLITDELKKYANKNNIWYINYRNFKLTGEKNQYKDHLANDNVKNTLTIGEFSPGSSRIENNLLRDRRVSAPRLNQILLKDFDSLKDKGVPIEISTRAFKSSYAFSKYYDNAFSGADIIQFKIDYFTGFEWLAFINLNEYIERMSKENNVEFYLLLNGKKVEKITHKELNNAGTYNLMVIASKNNIVTNFTDTKLPFKVGPLTWNVSNIIGPEEDLYKYKYQNNYKEIPESFIFIQKHIKYVPAFPENKEKTIQELTPIYKKL